MTALSLASVLFVALHLWVSGTSLRGRIVARIGEKPYLALFSLLSLGLLVWMSQAYAAADHVELWPPSLGARHGAALIMLFAVLALVVGLTTRSPTQAGGERLLAAERPASGVLTITRHPVMWAIALWAGAHILANGDLASVLFFASLGLLALAGPSLIDAKRARLDPDGWAAFAAVTSWLPFAAILRGRTRLDWRAIGWWRPLLGLVLYGALVLWLHEWIAGVPLMP